MDASKQPGIVIDQIFVERSNLAHRVDYLGHPPQSALIYSSIDVEFQADISPDAGSGLLRVTVKTPTDANALYTFEVAVVALVRQDPAAPNMPLSDFLTINGPTFLYPFVREAVAATTGRGRFGPVWLSPFNVAATLGEGIRQAPKTLDNADTQAPKP